MKTHVKNILTRVAILCALLAVVLGSPALAQFQPTPSVKSFRPTYQASVTGLVTAASATDFFTIQGSASKLVTVLNVECYGTASTAATADILMIKRSTANLTGTSTSPTAVPVDSNSGAATAVVKAYTVNPGTLGTAVGTLRAAKMALPLPATGAVLQRLQFLLGDGPFEQPVTLRGVAQTLALNGNAATLGTGAAVSCTVVWTES
jgi:hypothetical protein